MYSAEYLIEASVMCIYPIPQELVFRTFSLNVNNSNAYYFNMLLRTLALANIGYKTFATAKVQLFSDIHKKICTLHADLMFFSFSLCK